MERTSILYKARRSAQVAAHRLLPDELLCELYSKAVLKHTVNLRDPQTFNEKIQWLKLHYYPNTPLVVRGADKFRVRSYIAERGYADLLVPLLGDWSDAKSIRWDRLPEQFVLKCNHGCAYNIVCDDLAHFDRAAAARQLRQWMHEDFGAFNIELHYSKIKPHIICEKYLGACITDYKFFCFNGVPKYMYVSSDLIHDRQAHIGFFYLDGTKMPLTRDDYAPIDSISALPSFFPQMKQVAEALCRDFPFVRVDFFLADQTFYFAELTFTPSAGMMIFNPPEYDLAWGQELDIHDLVAAYEEKR